MKIILIFAKDKTFMVKARPFLKWVGGKTQLIEQLDAQFPADFDKWKDVACVKLSS